MATRFTLAIECGPSADIAERAAEAFRTLRLVLTGVSSPVECQVETTTRNAIHRVVVWPRGLAYGHPEMRLELLATRTFDQLRQQLLARLAKLDGYRVALFGREAQDEIAAFGDPISEPQLATPDLVFDETLAPPGSGLRRREEFRAGYRINGGG